MRWPWAPKVASCEGVDYSGSVSPIARADTAMLREVFDKYASVTNKEGTFMTSDDFVRKYLGMYKEDNYNSMSVAIVSGAADTTKDGLISFDEFKAFEAVLCSPDALYLTAFEMFDTNASDNVSYEEFERIIRHTSPVSALDFDFNSNFIKLYFGKDKKRDIGYLDFCQLLHDFYEEQGVQAFQKFDRDNTGLISAKDFARIMTTVKGHLLTKHVAENLTSAAGVAGGASHVKNRPNLVSYAYYMAFNQLLSKIEVFKRIHQSMSKGNIQIGFTKEEFLLEAQSYAQVTPTEVEILFHLAELRHPGNRLLTFTDIERVDPERLKRVGYIRRLAAVKVVEKPDDRTAMVQVMESTYRFVLGSIAGACGATAVYPIDLVKTRMQNQRTATSKTLVGEVMYKNSMDCFKKVVRHEGLVGLYRGLLPQIVGVAPEKAIKLTMNDFVRDKFTGQDGKIPLYGEIIAGGCGGGSQVMFTNPLEIVKIRLQVAGELQSGPKVNVFSVLKDLGLTGLYKGARACFLRDIPFSAIYFPAYAHAKLALANEDGHVSPGALFGSAMIAGVPAAGLVTPADVIKTRLQVSARAGQTTYSGVIDCFRKIVAEEGQAALWKGSVARVFRSSPQFGVTLLTYEMLQRVFYVDFGGFRPAGSEVSSHKTLADEASSNPDHLGGYSLARATFAGIETKFGLQVSPFPTSPGGFRPAGSEVSSHKTLADEASSNPDHLGGYSLARATFAGIETKFGLQVSPFPTSPGGFRPAGSEVSSHKTLADEASSNPDHLGGYSLARATFAGIETKFGIQVSPFPTSPGGFRPAGSEVSSNKTLADEASSNPDHLGGYSLARATFAGIETKFGLQVSPFPTSPGGFRPAGSEVSSHKTLADEASSNPDHLGGYSLARATFAGIETKFGLQVSPFPTSPGGFRPAGSEVSSHKTLADEASSNPDHLGGYSLARATFAGIETKFGLQVSPFPTSPGGFRPAGSEVSSHKTLADEASSNPDHLGGYSLARATFAGIETKFGLQVSPFPTSPGGFRPAGSEVSSHKTLADEASSNPDHLGGYSLARATFAGIETKFGLQVSPFPTSPGGFRPAGSEVSSHKTLADEASSNPDHQGGYSLARATFAGIETKFGLQVSPFPTSPGGFRPAGSEVSSHKTLADEASSNPDHLGGYSLARATFAGIETKFGLQVSPFPTSPGGFRPAGSEVSSHKTLADEASSNPDHLGGYSLARATFAGIETKFGLQVSPFPTSPGGFRPAGSEVSSHKTLADEASSNPDHLGGYSLARATFAGIETKFGLQLPKFAPASS